MLLPRLHIAVAALLLALAVVLGGVVMVADALTPPSTAPAASIPLTEISFPVSTEQCPASSTGWSIVNEIECLKGK
jgi:hypothetical protein